MLVREAFRRTGWRLWAPTSTPSKGLAAKVGAGHAVALPSGTAALHSRCALRLRRGEEVFCSTFTFAATANAIVYEGARPVFIDSDEAT